MGKRAKFSWPERKLEGDKVANLVELNDLKLGCLELPCAFNGDVGSTFYLTQYIFRWSVVIVHNNNDGD